MSSAGIFCLRLTIAVLAASLLLLLIACGSDPTLEPEATTAPELMTTTAPTALPTHTQAPTATPTPMPTATPVPTPTPMPEETLDDLLSSVEGKLAVMKTAKFVMIDETESGAPFFGTTFKSLEGQVKSPDSFRMLVSVVAPGLGFVEIEMLAVGEKAFMKVSEGAPWTPLPLEQVPLNFGEIGVT